ncbi:MAG TPA: proline iminopeptidase-family hydrolase [Tetragenococcus sp.]|nr:proline iminopeptidase-family hydrolase [Tetragenococcus sp.]
MQVTEGYMPFLEYQTYYRIVGDIKQDKAPLLLLHGGPGSTHNYFEVMDELANEGRAIISYDQLGCGLSKTPSRPDLWKARTWLDELEALRKYLNLQEVHLLGQSWGGMLAIEYLCDEKPTGVKSVVLASTLASNKLWEREQRRLITFLPEKYQEAIQKADESGVYAGDAYDEAIDFYMNRHCDDTVPKDDAPECIRRPKVKGTESYTVAWGPNEFSPLGTLKNHEYLEKLADVDTPALVTSGINDICTPVDAKAMYDRFPNSEWELFEYSRHMSFVEEHEKYMKVLSNWLNKND